MMKLTGLELQLRILQLIFQELEIKHQVVSSKQANKCNMFCGTFATMSFIIFLDEVEVTTADAADGNGNTTEDPTADIPGARDEISSGKW